MAGRRDPHHALASGADVRARKQINWLEIFFQNLSHEMRQLEPNFANELSTPK